MTNRNHAWAWSAATLLALNAAALSAAPDNPLARGNRGGGKTTTTTGTGTGTTTGTGTGTGTGSGGSGGGCPGGPGGPGGGPGGHGGGPGGGLLITGTITAVDTTADTITVTPTGGGTASVISITSNTNLIGHQTIAASAIALGDTLEVTGIPLAVQATSIVDNHLPAPTSTGTSTGTTSSSGSSSGTAPTPGTLRIVGVVTALVPPTIEVANTFSLALTVTTSTTFGEVLPLTFSQLAVGETVRAVATKSGTTLTAVSVDAAPAAS